MQPIFQNNSGQSANNGSGSYLSSRAVARKVLSAQVSLTSVFGMRTGGSSPPSPPLWYISRSRFVCPSLHVLPAFPDKYLFFSALQADNRIVNYFFRLFPFSVLSKPRLASCIISFSINLSLSQLLEIKPSTY